MRLTTFTLPIAFLGAACTGDIRSNGGPDAPPSADAPPGGPTMVRVSGTTMDYFSPTATPLPATTLSIEGVTPPVNNTSDTAGLYQIDVPPGSMAYAVATK